MLDYIGGQRIFHTLHHLFLSDFGVYLLVVDLRAIARKLPSALESMQFWLHSVKVHTEDAPVLIVGTFIEQLGKKDITKAIQVLQSFFRQEVPGVKPAEANVCLIDNKTGKGVQLLRDRIESVVKQLDHIHFKVSVKWMQILDELLASQDSWVR